MLDLKAFTKALHISPKSKLDQSVLLASIEQASKYLGESGTHESLYIYNAVCGIRWAVNTGRLTYDQETYIRGLSAYNTAKLIHTLASMKLGTAQAVLDHIKTLA